MLAHTHQLRLIVCGCQQACLLQRQQLICSAAALPTGAQEAAAAAAANVAARVPRQQTAGQAFGFSWFFIAAPHARVSRQRTNADLLPQICCGREKINKYKKKKK